MDEVGPAVVPSVAEIRRRFTRRRRSGGGPVDRAVRRALGLDAKARQYRAGAAFVRAAVDEVGVDGFNAVWTGPGSLPSAAEISDPGSWVRRIHG
jgi:putative hydrolase